MAKSGSFNTSAYSGRYLTFSWTAREPDLAKNQTTIDWTLKGAGKSSNGYYYAGNFKVVIDGATVYTKSNDNRIKLYEGTQVASGSYTFTHADDGTKGFSASVQAAVYYYAVNCTGSGSFTLDTIARASQPSLVTWPETTNDVGDFGETFSIHMNRKADIFTHTVRYEYGDRTGTIATNVATGTTWAVPLSFMNDIPESTRASGRIYVDTYNGSTLIGTKYTGFTVTVPASVKPSCTVTLEDISGVDERYGSPVKGLSKIKITVNATQAYSSPIASYAVTANGSKYNTAVSTTELLQTAGASRVTATVTDKRGRTSEVWSYDMNVQDYTPPHVTALQVHRCDADGTENDQGDYIQVTFSAEVTSLSNKNTAAYAVKYKQSSATAWTTRNFTELANNFTIYNHAFIFAADESNPYDVQVTATDRHSTATRQTSASTAFALMDWHPSGTGIRFGGVAQDEHTLQNDLAMKQVGNSYAFQPDAFDGAKGYTLLAVITLKTLNVNAPIVFKINRRGAICPMQVYVRFASSSTSTDPDLASITYEGDNYGAFMVKADTSIWKLYVDNTGGWSNPCLQEWFTTDNQMARLEVDFPNEQVEGESPSVLGTYYRATPAKMPSIFDYIYPVGSIYLSYSHVNPGTLFGGTWERLQNAFLWAVDASGEIGLTGGSKTHTLTVDELPAHSHGSVYSQHATGTKDKAWYNTSGSSVAYGAVSTGGGQAHNNMPPYIQVSAWRRTA